CPGGRLARLLTRLGILESFLASLLGSLRRRGIGCFSIVLGVVWTLSLSRWGFDWSLHLQILRHKPGLLCFRMRDENEALEEEVGKNSSGDRASPHGCC